MRDVFPHAPSRTVRDSFPSYGSPSGVDQVDCLALTSLPGEARLHHRGYHHTSLLAFRKYRPSLFPGLWPFGSVPTTATPPRHLHFSRRWPSPDWTEDDGSHVHALRLYDRVRPPLIPVRLTHNRRRSSMAHSPKARGIHPCAWAFGATSTYSRYTPSPTIPIIWRSAAHKGMSPGIPARSHTDLRPEDDWKSMG